MRLNNHIAGRFLDPLDKRFFDEGMEMLTRTAKWEDMPVERYASVFDLLSPLPLVDGTPVKNYYVTDSVISKLDMLHVTKKDKHFDYTVFQQVPDNKSTFVFPDNSLLRIVFRRNQLYFLFLKFTFSEDPVEKKRGHGHVIYVSFFADSTTGELAAHFDHKDVRDREEFIYKILCFIYLSENTEEILQPGQSKGTRKQGKVLNEFKVPLILVTSKWNVTSVRTEGFAVSGHFRLQRHGKEMSLVKMIFINPFEKKGYIRRAKTTDYGPSPDNN